MWCSQRLAAASAASRPLRLVGDVVHSARRRVVVLVEQPEARPRRAGTVSATARVVRVEGAVDVRGMSTAAAIVATCAISSSGHLLVGLPIGSKPARRRSAGKPTREQEPEPASGSASGTVGPRRGARGTGRGARRRSPPTNAPSGRRGRPIRSEHPRPGALGAHLTPAARRRRRGCRRRLLASPRRGQGRRTVTVTHGPVDAVYTDLGAKGPASATPHSRTSPRRARAPASRASWGR
jgi:hypothetical protein